MALGMPKAKIKRFYFFFEVGRGWMKEDGSLKQYARQLIFVALSENRKERKAIHPIPCIFIIAKI